MRHAAHKLQPAFTGLEKAKGRRWRGRAATCRQEQGRAGVSSLHRLRWCFCWGRGQTWCDIDVTITSRLTHTIILIVAFLEAGVMGWQLWFISSRSFGISAKWKDGLLLFFFFFFVIKKVWFHPVDEREVKLLYFYNSSPCKPVLWKQYMTHEHRGAQRGA